MSIDVRTLEPDDLGAWLLAAAIGFHRPGAGGPDEVESRRPHVIADRTWGAFDGSRVVATLRTFPTEVTVPGGAPVSTTAITAVTTLASHRRRGLASAMMRSELDAAKERGEDTAVLIAAEYPIYGRFGFGPATWQHTWTVDAATAAPRRPAPPGSVEYLDEATSRALAPELAERARRSRPGDIGWVEETWNRHYGTSHLPSWPEHKKFFSVLARDAAGTPIGLVHWRYAEKWESWLPVGSIEIELMIAEEADAYELLWNFLLGVDLVKTIVAGTRRVDEPLPWLLSDARRAQASERNDFLWLRPLDTAAFLAARRYAVHDRVVLEVTDPLGLAGGRFVLDGGPDGSSCAPSTASADLSVSIGTLSSVSLGGARLTELAAAGRVDEHTPGATARADLLFATATAPWCSRMF